MQWDAVAAIKHSETHAKPHSLGRCAQYTREAVEAGGVKLTHHVSAKDYGSSLAAVGFDALSQAGYSPKAGDVGVIQPIKGHPHGHIAMYDGKHWISDFVQLHGLYPGAGYRAAKPPFTIYRHPANVSQVKELPASVPQSNHL